VPEPELAGDQVLVRVAASVFGAPELAGRFACTPGGAAVGTVQRTSQDAAHLLGKRVVVGPEQACGECDVCRRGAAAVCPRGSHLGRTADGTLATAVVARARWVCPLEGELAAGPGLDGPAAAFIGREAAWAYTMVARAGVAPGEPVVIVGAGVLARFLVQIAVAKGARPLVLVTGDEDSSTAAWADWIAARGGVAVRPDKPDSESSNEESARRAVQAAADRGGHGSRPWFVFETSAQTVQRTLALALAGPGARLTLLARRALGSPEPGPDLPLDRVLDADGTVIGVTGAHPDLIPEVAALVVRGELDIEGAAEVLSPEQLNIQLTEGLPPPQNRPSGAHAPVPTAAGAPPRCPVITPGFI
jgi:D-arabinose 1-dehydrogenase-like Zn-dependent alcohol dehydrogenase